MKQIDRLYRCRVPGQVFGIWELQCRLRIYFSHPEVQTVVISDMGLESAWFIPYKAEYLANLIVAEFQLNPNLVIWIEHYSPQFRKPSCSSLNLVTFDWRNGEATHPRWSPIDEKMVVALTGETLHPTLLPS